jgi:hypothetical protein
MSTTSSSLTDFSYGNEVQVHSLIVLDQHTFEGMDLCADFSIQSAACASLAARVTRVTLITKSGQCHLFKFVVISKVQGTASLGQVTFACFIL